MAEHSPRTVANSQSSITRLMLPTDANFMGNVFGGVILSEIDRTAYIAAIRHAGLNCVTASFDRVDFEKPVHVGQVVEFTARLTYVGHTSMEVSIEANAEALLGGPKYRVVRAWVTMVAVDQDGRPTSVRPLALTSEAERREFAEGERRMRDRGRARTEASGSNGNAPRTGSQGGSA